MPPEVFPTCKVTLFPPDSETELGVLKPPIITLSELLENLVYPSSGRSALEL